MYTIVYMEYLYSASSIMIILAPKRRCNVLVTTSLCNLDFVSLHSKAEYLENTMLPSRDFFLIVYVFFNLEHESIDTTGQLCQSLLGSYQQQ